MPLQFSSQLALLGWDEWFQERFALFAHQGFAPARVVADYGAEYLVHDGEEALRASAGRHLRNDGGQLPAVGDWVALRHHEPASTIHGWVERKTDDGMAERRSAGRRADQVRHRGLTG